MAVNQRIKILIEELKLSQGKFAQIVGLNQNLISRTVNAETTPNFEAVEKIYRGIKNISPHWLLTGEGEIWTSRKPVHYNAIPLGTPFPNLVNIASEPTTSYGQKEDCEELRKQIKVLEDLVSSKDKIIYLLENQMKLI